MVPFPSFECSKRDRHQGSLLLFHEARSRRQKQSRAGLFLFSWYTSAYIAGGAMAYYKVRIEVWCDWNPAESDLDDIAQAPSHALLARKDWPGTRDANCNLHFRRQQPSAFYCTVNVREVASVVKPEVAFT